MSCDYAIDFRGEWGDRYRVYEVERGTNKRRLLTPMLASGSGFPSKKQAMFFDSTTPYTLFSGSRGPGKTAAICYDALYGAYLVPGSKQIIFRRTMGELDKLMDVDEIIPTPNGFFRNGDLKTGDYVFSPSGNPVQILKAHPIQIEEGYRVSFDDGTSTIVHDGHLWFTQTYNDQQQDRKGSVKTTQEILDTLLVKRRTKMRNHRIPLTSPLQMPDAQLPIDPYVLGCWLGDGTSRCGQLTGIDIEIIDELRRRGQPVRPDATDPQRWLLNGGKDHPDYSFNACSGAWFLRPTKHVPDIYLFASEQQRLDLLRGLMDTDGSITDGHCCFGNMNKNLAEAVYFLAASLGIRPSWHQTRDGYIKVGFATSLPVFILPRKLKRIRPKTTTRVNFRYITNIEPVGKRKMRCLTVDEPDGLYLFGKNCNITHNTIISTMKSWPQGLIGKYHGETGNENFLLPCMNAPQCSQSPCPHSSYIYFGSAPNEESVRKMLSGEYMKILFDEWSEFPYSMWRFISGSARTPTTTDIFGQPVMAQIKGCCNPGGIGGDALNHLFGCEVPQSVPMGDDAADTYDPKDYLYIHTTIEDNPAYSSDQPAGKAYRKMLKSQPPNIRASWIEGRWSGFEGQYFDNFDSKLVKVPHDKALTMVAKQYWQPFTLGGDWGSVHYSWFGLLCFIELPLANGYKHTFPLITQEFMEKGLSEKALAEEIAFGIDDEVRRRVTRCYMSPETFGDTARSRARKMGDVFVTYKMPRPQPAVAEPANGFRYIYSLLDERHELSKDVAWTQDHMVSGLLIDETCTAAFEAIPWAVTDKKKDGNVQNNKTDNPLMDVLDGLRYVLHSVAVKGAQKSEDEKYRDKIKSLPISGLERYAEYLKHMKELREANAHQPKINKWMQQRHPRMGARR